MSKKRGLTLGQGIILLLLILATVAVLFFMRQAIQTAQQGFATVSLLPSPTPGPTATPTPTPTVTPTPTPYFTISMAGTLAREVAAARGLLARWETPLTPVDAYDLSVVLYRRYRAAPPFPLSEQRLLEILELWPADFEAAPDPVAQAQLAAALYFPDEGQLYVRRDWPGEVDAIRAMVAYSYARALADQYGNLTRLQTESSALDRRLALEALAQGDALLSLWLFAGVAPGSPEAEALADAIAAANLPEWRAPAPVLDRLARLPLRLGSAFALEQYANGGSAAMDEALRRPARATRQLLEPDAYAAWTPQLVFDPLTVSLGRNWAAGHTETVGAALMAFTFAEWSGNTITPTLAGWNHDLLQTWEGPEGKRVTLWQTAWDSTEHAAAVFEALTRIAPTRLPGRATTTLRPEGVNWGRWWALEDEAVYLYRAVNRVWLVWGNDDSAVQTIARALQ